MPASLVSVVANLTPGIQTRFADTYARHYEGMRAKMGMVMDLAVPSQGAYEIYTAFNSAPYARRWDRGNPRFSKGFTDFQFTVNNVDWNVGVEAHVNDVMDDRSQYLEKQAQDAGGSVGGLPERVFYQAIQGATDPALLAAVPNAPDGAAMFSATTGAGGDRFGVSGGNLITGSGVATSGAIISDFFNATERFRQFQDTEGQPLFDGAIIDKPLVLTYNVANDKVVQEAFKQSRPVSIVQNVAGTENVAAAAVTNIIMESGYQVSLWPTQRITTNDLFLFATGSPVKPFFQQTRQASAMRIQTPENSDEARRNKIVGWYWDCREGYGVNTPYGAIKVDN